MLHSSRYLVYFDAEQLSSATKAEKKDMLGSIIVGLENQEIRASNTAQCLVEDITGIEAQGAQSHSVNFATDTSHGEFTPQMSLRLIRDIERLHGFAHAIKRWPEQEGIIDVGSGSFPILALMAAMYHPNSQVQAIEINPEAAEASRQIIEFFGLDDRIEVVNEDIANHSIDSNTSASVTETFNAGLQEEPGPKIVRLLHENGVPLITPSLAQLRLCLPSGEFYQDIDMRLDAFAEIDFSELDSDDTDGLREISLSAEYYDDLGLVLPYGTDAISKHLNFGASATLRRTMSKAESSGQLVYELGAYPFEPVVKTAQPTI